jgi:hypothetical protein
MNREANENTTKVSRGRFPWGRIIQTHTVGPYTVVEFAERGADNHPTHPRQETGRNLFHISRNDSWSGESFPSLDLALIGAIDMRVNGSSSATVYAGRVLGIA